MSKTEKELVSLYDGEVQITYYPNSHRYMIEKEILLSVTGATDVVDKSAQLVHWAVNLTKAYLLDIKDSGEQISIKDIENACLQHKIRKEKAADIGTMVHDWAEKFAKGENPPLPAGDTEQSEKVLNGVLAFLKWVEENKVRFLETERLVYSKKHRYVGRMDLAFTMGIENHEVFHMGDYKTASGIYSSARYQTSGYLGAYLEEMAHKMTLKVGSSWILRFAKEDKYRDGELVEEAGTFETCEISPEENELDYAAFLACVALKRREKSLSKY